MYGNWQQSSWGQHNPAHPASQRKGALTHDGLADAHEDGVLPMPESDMERTCMEFQLLPKEKMSTSTGSSQETSTRGVEEVNGIEIWNPDALDLKIPEGEVRDGSCISNLTPHFGSDVDEDRESESASQGLSTSRHDGNGGPPAAVR